MRQKRLRNLESTVTTHLGKRRMRTGRTKAEVKKNRGYILFYASVLWVISNKNIVSFVLQPFTFF